MRYANLTVRKLLHQKQKAYIFSHKETISLTKDLVEQLNRTKNANENWGEQQILEFLKTTPAAGVTH
jgi:hypothetical protein